MASLKDNCFASCCIIFPLSTHQVLLHYELNHHASVLSSAKTVWDLGTDMLMHLNPTCNWLFWNMRPLCASHNRPRFYLQYFIVLWFSLPPSPHIERLTPFMKQVLASTSQSQRMMSPPLEPTARVLGCVGCHSRHVTLLSKGLALRKRQYEERECRKASSNLC